MDENKELKTVNEDEQLNEIKKKKIIIGLPGDSFSSKFLTSWSNILISLWSSNKYEIAISTGTGSYVPHVRMQTLGLDVPRGHDQKPFNGDEYDIWMTIDSDIMFTPEQVIELIESTEKHPVVSGIYRMVDLQHFSCVKLCDDDYYATNGTYEFVSQETLENWKKEPELKYMPVDYTGLGFMACRKEVFDKMSYPYFDGTVKDIKKDDKIIKSYMSEDYNFCNNIKKAGFEIMINTNLRVGHMKHLII